MRVARLFEFVVLVSVFGAPLMAEEEQVATFAGGCFWCMELPFDKLDGVVSTTSGYAGGKEKDPTYGQVANGQTTHREVVQVKYDPTKVSYQELLDVFWKNIDPFDSGGQFCDRGFQYTTAVFYHTDEQRKLAEASKEKLVSSGRFNKKIVTPITDVKAFYPAEGYHQDFYKKSPVRYKSYRYGCGRDRRLRDIWGK